VDHISELDVLPNAHIDHVTLLHFILLSQFINGKFNC